MALFRSVVPVFDNLRKYVLDCVMATQQDDAGKAWVETLHRRIAATIRHARTRAGMSAQDVADATEELGHALSRDKIANYESGRKQGLDIAELLVIAAALRVPPVTLLFDGHPRENVELLPGHEIPNLSALAWFCGDEDLANDAVAEPNLPSVAILRLVRQRAHKQRQRETAGRMASYYAGEDDEAKFTPAIEWFLTMSDDVTEIDAEIDRQWSAIVADREEEK